MCLLFSGHHIQNIHDKIHRLLHQLKTHCAFIWCHKWCALILKIQVVGNFKIHDKVYMFLSISSSVNLSYLPAFLSFPFFGIYFSCLSFLCLALVSSYIFPYASFFLSIIFRHKYWMNLFSLKLEVSELVSFSYDILALVWTEQRIVKPVQRGKGGRINLY